MNDKQAMLTKLKEEFDRWEGLLSKVKSHRKR